MAILFDQEKKIFKMDAGRGDQAVSWVSMVSQGDYLLHLYFGPFVQDTDLSYLVRLADRAFSPNPIPVSDRTFSLDTQLQEYPCYGIGDYRSAALAVQGPDGSLTTDLRYTGHRVEAGKPSLPGLPSTYVESPDEAETLVISLADSCTGLEAELRYTVYQAWPVITRSVTLKNAGRQSLVVRKAMSFSLDLPDADYDLIHLHGAWARERQIERLALHHGQQRVGSLRGSSSHMHHPFIALAAHGSDQQQGQVIGCSLVYSGNFIAEAEVDQYETTRVSMGIHPDDFSWQLTPGGRFDTPEAVLVYSRHGLDGMSQIFHQLYATRLCRGVWRDRQRPLLVNNWEATYFQFNADKLVSLAEKAASAGIEMLVMDDGWFGKRDDDSSGLGDWVVNEQKLGCTLHDLVERVKACGLHFGIWFEPEMVNPDSDLYRAHPDWCVHVDGRGRSTGRSQLVLDLSRTDVVDYLDQTITDVLQQADISYVKWDMNRNITEPGSALLPPERQQEFFHRYILGVYALMDRLIRKFPEILFEGCSGGGGRFDPGILSYMPQFWTSDDTDAIERLRIQAGTAMIYPLSTQGSHVSAVPNHQTQRITPMRTRGHVALFGTGGYELDLTALTEQDLSEIRSQVKLFHRYQNLIRTGRFYQLDSAFAQGGRSNRTTWQLVSQDRKQALVMTCQILCEPNGKAPNVKLAGLDPQQRYQVGLPDREVEQDLPLSLGIFRGDILMQAGLNLPYQFGDYGSVLFDLTAID